MYKAAENGDLITVVSRPWWYGLLNFGFCWCVSFCGALGIGVLKFLNFRRKYLAAKKYKSNDTKAVISSKKANRILKYMQITTAVQAAYTVLDIVFGIWFNGILCIGIVPVTAHFIVSNIIIWNTLDFLQAPEDEISILDYWKTCETVSFIIAFLSVIVAVGFAMAGIS